MVGVPLRPVSAAICVPVRNEETALPKLLEAIERLDLGDVEAAVFFLLDNCSDASEQVILEHAGRMALPFTVAQGDPSPDANAGRARRAAIALGLHHAASTPHGILLTTDADSQPRADWVRAALQGLASADLVAGRIVRIAAERDPVQGRVERYLDRLHAYRRSVDPVPWDSPTGSHCSGGANMAFRPGAYQALGGFQPVPCGEDAALLDDAGRAGFRVRRDPGMVVATSSRRLGRAPGGMAAALSAIDHHGAPSMPHPRGAAWQYRQQAEARRIWAGLPDSFVAARFGDRIGLTGDHVIGVARDCPNAEAFAMRVVPALPDIPDVTLAEAEHALATLENQLCEQAA